MVSVPLKGVNHLFFCAVALTTTIRVNTQVGVYRLLTLMTGCYCVFIQGAYGDLINATEFHMARQFYNSDDVIDSRDVIARLEELEDEHTALREALQEAIETRNEALAERPDVIHTDLEQEISKTTNALIDWRVDNQEELNSLRALAEEASGSPDWQYGETLIRESYFQDYAMQLAEDIGAVKGDEGWPLNCIDWEKAARELKYDYFAVDFDGVTYYVRS